MCCPPISWPLSGALGATQHWEASRNVEDAVDRHPCWSPSCPSRRAHASKGDGKKLLLHTQLRSRWQKPPTLQHPYWGDAAGENLPIFHQSGAAFVTSQCSSPSLSWLAPGSAMQRECQSWPKTSLKSPSMSLLLLLSCPSILTGRETLKNSSLALPVLGRIQEMERDYVLWQFKGGCLHQRRICRQGRCAGCTQRWSHTHLPNAVSNGIFQLSGWNLGTGEKSFSTRIQNVQFFFQATRVKKSENLWFGLVEMCQLLK